MKVPPPEGDGSEVILWLIIAAIIFLPFLSGCASTFAKGYLDKPVTALEEDLGRPYDVIEVSETRRVYQYYWGGGTYVVPGHSASFITGSVVNTLIYPAETRSSPGCLISFTAEPPEGPGGWRNPDTNDPWVVVEVNWPRRLVC